MRKFTNISEGTNFGKNVIDDNRIIYKDEDFFIMYDGFLLCDIFYILNLYS